MINIEGSGEPPHCREALQNMYEYLDGELTSPKREHVQLHLDDCIPCLEAFEFEAELKAVISSRCRDEVPAELYSRVRMSLKAEIDATPPEGGIPKV